MDQLLDTKWDNGVYTASKPAREAVQRRADIKTAERAQLGSNYNSFG